MIWLLLAIVILSVLLYACQPLYDARPAEADITPEIADYQHRIAELEARIAAGDEDSEALQIKLTELKRHLLSSAESPPSETGKRPMNLVAALFILSTMGAFGLYAYLGRPGLTEPGALQKPVLTSPQAAGTAAVNETASLEELLVSLKAKLDENPDRPDGWMLYARSLMTLQRFDEAFAAYERALELTDQDPNVAAELAQARAYAARPPGPSAEDMRAAEQMSEADRAAMIENMVEGLAARLRDNPQDRDGWVRLLKARQVLGQTEKARADIDILRAAFASEPETIENILRESGWPE